MRHYNRPIIKILPVIAVSFLLMNEAIAEESAAPACLAIPDSQESCCGHAHPGGVAGMDTFERMNTEMALTDAQKQELAALLEMYRPRIKELAERGMTNGQAMFAIAPDDASYNARAAELSQLAGATTAEMVTLLTELQANAYALLTAAQKTQFLELRAEQRQKMEAKRASMQERRERGDWTTGQHFGHGQGKHCLDTPPTTDNSAASDTTE